MEAIFQFLFYALTAALLENIFFTRALGIRHAMFGSPREILSHGVILTGITFASSFLCYGVRHLLAEQPLTPVLAALCYLACVTIVYLAFLPVCRRPDLRRMLPVSAFNCAVLGALILSSPGQDSLAAAAGFGLGSGVGYTLALFLIKTGRQRLELITLPRAFKGMPILLLYTGIVSLAIYGLIGHQLPT